MLLALTGLCSIVLAQEAEPTQPESEDMDAGRITEIDPFAGLIINRTITVIGWNFYKEFSEIWQSLYPDSDRNLTITERPTAQFGSEIWVHYLDRSVFHTFLSPARSQVREMTKQAVSIAHENIAQIDLERAVFEDEDLGPEEL
ncbi:MAG TPA: curli production assembly/transport protein CsgE [Burkholderiaceae bacterium]|nr:curli production assembly/transport protein CsgE [Burkholderiaceae bacterium]